MKPQRIILIRHGESEGNVNQAVYVEKPDYTLELTATGRVQAEQAGEALGQLVGAESVFFYVSPLWRTRMTFEGLVAHLPPAQYRWREEPRLREQDWGHLRTEAECAATSAARDAFGTFYYRIPDGESAADVYDRVSDFLGTLYRDFDKPDYPQNVVLVTHGLSLRMFLMRWFHFTVEEFEALANPKNCEIVVLALDPTTGKYALTTPLRQHRVWHQQQRPVLIALPPAS